jgi:hypothetical protein
MFAVNLPASTASGAQPESANDAVQLFLPQSAPADTFSTPLLLDYTFTRHTVPGLGDYYTVEGSTDVSSPGWQPVQPRASYDIKVDGAIAHGVLMTGGEFTGTATDPLISRVITDDATTGAEPGFPNTTWFPAFPAAINRIPVLTSDPDRRLELAERLVVVPGQFLSSNTGLPTVGTQRLYQQVQLELYYAPEDETDFISPNIWTVEFIPETEDSYALRAKVVDNNVEIQRVVGLYRKVGGGRKEWTRVEMGYDPITGWAAGAIPTTDGLYEYFVQAVDAAGNTAVALDRGNPFQSRIMTVLQGDLAVSLQASKNRVLALNSVNYVLTAKNKGPVDAANVKAVVQLPRGVRLTATPPGCTLASDQVTCAWANIPKGETRRKTLTALVSVQAAHKLDYTAAVTSNLNELNAADNRVKVTTQMIHTQGIYANDFSGAPGQEWSLIQRATSPSGRAFLGQFGNDTTRLRLSGLPAHRDVTVSFDLYLIRSWNGSHVAGHPNDEIQDDRFVPDIWSFSADQTVRLRTTFANVAGYHQSFPEPYPAGSYQPFTRAFQVNSLGYRFNDRIMDSVYRLSFTFPHTRDSLTLDFSAFGLEMLLDESWGLDNVKVAVHAWHTVFAPLGFH